MRSAFLWNSMRRSTDGSWDRSIMPGSTGKPGGGRAFGRQADGSIANWHSQRQVMRQIVDHGPDMVAIFEDDAGLSPQLPGGSGGAGAQAL